MNSINFRDIPIIPLGRRSADDPHAGRPVSESSRTLKVFVSRAPRILAIMSA
jgi:hypothetical protein